MNNEMEKHLNQVADQDSRRGYWRHVHDVSTPAATHGNHPFIKNTLPAIPPSLLRGRRTQFCCLRT